jgi:DNA-nicking Smr family endonuclease
MLSRMFLQRIDAAEKLAAASLLHYHNPEGLTALAASGSDSRALPPARTQSTPSASVVTIDLHGLHAKEAVSAIADAVDAMPHGAVAHVVTGKGKTAKMKHSVASQLSELHRAGIVSAVDVLTSSAGFRVTK